MFYVKKYGVCGLVLSKVIQKVVDVDISYIFQRDKM